MRSLEDRIELANAFVYTAGQRAQIVALMRPCNVSRAIFDAVDKPRLDARCNDFGGIPTDPEETCIESVTGIARRGLAAFLEPRRTTQGERERYCRYVTALEQAAQELEAALPRRRVDGGTKLDHYGPGPYLFLDDWLARQQAGDLSLPANPFSESRALAATLRRHAAAASHVLDGIDAGYAASFVATTHNPNRWLLALDLLDRQRAETGNRPGRSRTSAAARLLLAALDPAMLYANRIMDIGEARPLLTGENAANLIRRWQPLRG